MNWDKLKAAHLSELCEAGKKPGLLILPDKLIAARAVYLKLKDSSIYYRTLAALLKENAEQEAQDNMDKAACRSLGRLEGAIAILSAFEIDMEGCENNKHS